MAAAAHLPGNDDAFEFDDITDDEAVVAAKAEAKAANTGARNRHQRIRNRVRAVFYPLPSLDDITKKWKLFVRGRLQFRGA